MVTSCSTTTKQVTPLQAGFVRTSASLEGSPKAILVSVDDILEMLKISKATLKRLRRKDRSFPQPLDFGLDMRTRRWVHEEIVDWIEHRRALRDAKLVNTRPTAAAA